MPHYASSDVDDWGIRISLFSMAYIFLFTPGTYVPFQVTPPVSVPRQAFMRCGIIKVSGFSHGEKKSLYFELDGRNCGIRSNFFSQPSAFMLHEKKSQAIAPCFLVPVGRGSEKNWASCQKKCIFVLRYSFKVGNVLRPKSNRKKSLDRDSEPPSPPSLFLQWGRI